jgi:2,4-dienoyl-CoA reductase-like NADH-dependent reductase (Old Yellow Enzyme family)
MTKVSRRGGGSRGGTGPAILPQAHRLPPLFRYTVFNKYSPLEDQMRQITTRLVATAVALVYSSAIANAAEVKVLTAGALQVAMRSLAADFERQTGNHVTVTATNPANVEKDLAAGQFDVIAAARPTTAELDESGRLQKIGRAHV